jgi:hypothetical protein
MSCPSGGVVLLENCNTERSTLRANDEDGLIRATSEKLDDSPNAGRRSVRSEREWDEESRKDGSQEKPDPESRRSGRTVSADCADFTDDLSFRPRKSVESAKSADYLFGCGLAALRLCVSASSLT